MRNLNRYLLIILSFTLFSSCSSRPKMIKVIPLDTKEDYLTDARYSQVEPGKADSPGLIKGHRDLFPPEE